MAPRAPSAYRPEILWKQRWMTRGPRSELFAPDVEASQTLCKMPRNISYSDDPSMAIGLRQVAEQLWRCASKRHLQIERERFFIESCHGDMRTKIER